MSNAERNQWGETATFAGERIRRTDDSDDWRTPSVPFHKRCAEKHFGKSAASRQAAIDDLTRAITTVRALLREVLGSRAWWTR